MIARHSILATFLTSACSVVDIAFHQQETIAVSSNAPERIATGTLTGDRFIHAKGATLSQNFHGGFRSSSSNPHRDVRSTDLDAPANINIDNSGIEKHSESRVEREQATTLVQINIDGPRGGQKRAVPDEQRSDKQKIVHEKDAKTRIENDDRSKDDRGKKDVNQLQIIDGSKNRPKSEEPSPFRLFFDSALIWCILAPFIGVVICVLALRPEAVFGSKPDRSRQDFLQVQITDESSSPQRRFPNSRSEYESCATSSVSPIRSHVSHSQVQGRKLMKGVSLGCLSEEDQFGHSSPNYLRRPREHHTSRRLSSGNTSSGRFLSPVDNIKIDDIEFTPARGRYPKNISNHNVDVCENMRMSIFNFCH